MTNGADSGRYPWFPLYAANFLADENVVMMSAAEVGVYVQLMCHAWKEGSIPDAPRALARLGRVTDAELADMWPVLAPCFTAGEPGRLVHPGLEQQRGRLAEKSESARRSAEARWSPEKRQKRSRKAREVTTSGALMRSQSGRNAEGDEAHRDDTPEQGELGALNGSGDHSQVTAGAAPERSHSERNANKSTGDKKNAPPSGEGARAGAKSAKKDGPKRKHPLPDDWEPKQHHRDLATRYGLDVDTAALKMRNWSLGGGNLKLDWDRTFTNWIIGEAERGGSRPAAASSAPTRPRDPGAWEDSVPRYTGDG